LPEGSGSAVGTASGFPLVPFNNIPVYPKSLSGTVQRAGQIGADEDDGMDDALPKQMGAARHDGMADAVEQANPMPPRPAGITKQQPKKPGMMDSVTNAAGDVSTNVTGPLSDFGGLASNAGDQILYNNGSSYGSNVFDSQPTSNPLHNPNSAISYGTSPPSDPVSQTAGTAASGVADLANVVGGGLGAISALKGLNSASKARGGDDTKRYVEGGSNALAGAASATTGLMSGISLGAEYGSTATEAAVSGLSHAVPGLGLATSVIGATKASYQMIEATKNKNSLANLAEAHKDTDHAEMIKYAADTQLKNQKRAGLNLAASGMSVAGGIVNVTGVGAGVGSAVSAGGTALRLGAAAARAGKQSARDGRAEREADIAQAQIKADAWNNQYPDMPKDHTDYTEISDIRHAAGKVSDKIFKPNTEKTTAKKQEKLTGFADQLLDHPDADLKTQVLQGIGANKEDIANLQDPEKRNETKNRIMELAKRRE
jgi:hypothetical protein